MNGSRPAKIKISVPASYENLLHRVKETLIEGHRRIEEERVKAYWETGQLIHRHVLKYAKRAEYGAEVIARLARDLNADKTILNRCLKFAQTYPRLPIVARGQQFKWSHFRKLITISDDKQRALLEDAAKRNAWSVDELTVRIKNQRPKELAPLSEKPAVPEKLLTPLRGELYTYRLVERPTLGPAEDSGLLVDLGFGIFRDVEPRVAAQFSKDDIVDSRPKEDAWRFTKNGRTAKELFTYKAFVEKVIDGDTLKVRFDLGFNTWMRETLRLRGLDCPEMGTKEGQAAKAFVQSYIKEAQMLIIRSSRADKYDRYLADVFIPTGSGPDEETDIYLNNLLVEHGHARRME